MSVSAVSSPPVAPPPTTAPPTQAPAANKNATGAVANLAESAQAVQSSSPAPGTGQKVDKFV